MNNYRKENELKIRSVRNSLKFIDEHLDIIKGKIPSDLTEEELDVTFDYIEEKFTSYLGERKEAEQLFGVKSLANANKILCTLESKLYQDDNTSWCIINKKAFKVKTVRDWVDLNHELISESKKYIEEDLDYLNNFRESLSGWHDPAEDPMESPRAGELLTSAEKISETAVRNIINAKQNTWIVIPSRRE